MTWKLHHLHNVPPWNICVSHDLSPFSLFSNWSYIHFFLKGYIIPYCKEACFERSPLRHNLEASPFHIMWNSLWEFCLCFIGFIFVFHHAKLKPHSFCPIILIYAIWKTHITAILKQFSEKFHHTAQCSTLGIESVFHSNCLCLSLFSHWSHIHFGSQCYILLYSKEACKYHSKTM
jgi:hypothetical protein